MRIHRIQKKETPDGDWEHVAWVEKSPQATARELDRQMVEQPNVYKWRIIPYRQMDDDIREFYRRV